MNLGIVVFLLALCCIGASITVHFIKDKYRLIAIVALTTFFIGLLICLYTYGEELYAGGNLPLARATFLVGGALFGTLLVIPLVRKNNIATWVDMGLFLVLAIAFVILAVYLSKTVIQPNAPLA